MDKLAYTLAEAIEVSGFSRSTLYNFFKSGEIKPRKSGTKILIIASELKDFLERLPVA